MGGEAAAEVRPIVKSINRAGLDVWNAGIKPCVLLCRLLSLPMLCWISALYSCTKYTNLSHQFCT